MTRTPSEARTPRMEPLARLPVFFALGGKRAVIAGGSAAAAWKAELLAAAGAAVDVYATGPSDEMVDIAAQAGIAIHQRDIQPADFTDAVLAIGAFDDDGGASAFAALARAAGVPVNVIDKPAFCDFSFGAIVNRSPLVIGISTDGAAPVFGQAIRAKFEALIPRGFARWAEAARRWRDGVKTSGLSFGARRRFWERFTERAITEPERAPASGDIDTLMSEVRGASVDAGSVVLVGAGPGDPELLTLRAVRALQSADVILIDDLVSPQVLDFARREAKKMLVGKTGFGPSCTQEDINSLIVSLAKQGKRVVRLKGGDPLIFGRAAEEIAACEAASIAVDVVPGITSVQGAAARLGIALTDRKKARRLQYVTGHAKQGGLPADVDWKSLADPSTTTAVFMPTRTLAALAEKAIVEGLDRNTPAIAISRATRPDQAVVTTPIAELAEQLAQAGLPGPVLVLIGNTISSAGGAVSRRSNATA